jgi:hypothetical protein
MSFFEFMFDILLPSDPKCGNDPSPSDFSTLILHAFLIFAVRATQLSHSFTL